MALPTSRNETAVNAAAVDPDLLNDVQDCIIGMKFPATDFPIGGAGFYLISGTATFNNARWDLTGTSTLVHEPVGALGLPGTVIHSITLYGNRNNTGSLIVSLNSRNLLTDSAEAPIEDDGIVSGTGHANATLTLTGGGYVILADTPVWIAVSGINTQRVTGIVINASRL